MSTNYRRPTEERRGTQETQLPQRIASTALLGARKKLIIEHNGREYRLELTRNGKLILTA